MMPGPIRTWHGRDGRRNHGKASAGFEKAVELSPNFAYAHAMHGAANAYGGKPDAAIQSIDTAIKLSPRDTFLDNSIFTTAWPIFRLGITMRAAEAADRALHLKPEHPNSHMLAASANAHAGNMERLNRRWRCFENWFPAPRRPMSNGPLPMNTLLTESGWQTASEWPGLRVNSNKQSQSKVFQTWARILRNSTS